MVLGELVDLDVSCINVRLFLLILMGLIGFDVKRLVMVRICMFFCLRMGMVMRKGLEMIMVLVLIMLMMVMVFLVYMVKLVCGVGWCSMVRLVLCIYRVCVVGVIFIGKLVSILIMLLRLIFVVVRLFVM